MELLFLLWYVTQKSNHNYILHSYNDDGVYLNLQIHQPYVIMETSSLQQAESNTRNLSDWKTKFFWLIALKWLTKMYNVIRTINGYILSIIKDLIDMWFDLSHYLNNVFDIYYHSMRYLAYEWWKNVLNCTKNWPWKINRIFIIQ